MADSQVLLLNLCYQPFLDALYKPLFDSLSAKADLKRANERAEALRYLELSRPVAIIATDAGLTESENGQVVEAVLQYVRNGGILILGLDFPSSIAMDEFDSFFQRKLNLPWASGDYHRDDFEINEEGIFPPPGGSRENFPQNYNMKALHIKNASPEQRLYTASDSDQAAIVGTSYGEGYVAYIGDCNGEAEMGNFILGLIGLA
ncbi:hypothetical protein TWF730_009649 [Orbilia blumenaviensis]|uniref:Uncharacterized protein n=1 Tax=Orbilia blumenaviensis TaxID=1796055 RepID=A0AAV9UTT9_9PEZI